LKERDIIDLDFRKLKHIRQEGANYLLNKIINYVPGRMVKAEMIRVKNTTAVTLPDLPEEPPVIGFCFEWTAYNEGDIKMGIDGEIDFTIQLGARTINTGLSSGAITSYIIDGSTVACFIPMTFNAHKAMFSTDGLPVIAGEVLTSVTISVLVVCNDASEIELNEAYGGIEVPGDQVTASFNECY